MKHDNMETRFHQNKGIQMATGDIVGMLNADDYFADNEVLREVAAAYQEQDIGILFGDLDYVDRSNRIIRKWRSGEFGERKVTFGWMPPHPTFYCKKSLFSKYGLYSTTNGTAADYDLMLRFLYVHQIKSFYLQRVMVKMTSGGVSNLTIKNRLLALFFDFKAMRENDLPLPLLALLLKPIRKITQFL
jgi:glycosyltransferase involved in cell wall biosynthesis